MKAGIRIISFVVLLAMVLALVDCSDWSKTPQVTADQIIQRIHEPVFPSAEVNVADFGAKGDSITDCKPAFDAAIRELTAKGGGKLVVPQGVFTVNGPIHLESRINLYLSKGSVIRFGSNPANYLPVVKTSWEGTLLFNYSPFIYAYQCQNVAITGEGRIDGEASETWSKWASIQKNDQELSRKMNNDAVPVEQRLFGEGHYLRPQLIQFYECKNILVEGVTIEDSPFWCIHLLMSQNSTLRKIKYDAQNKNNDGIDPEYSKDVLIEDIDFNNADDNVAVKAGRDLEGRTLGISSENIVIRNCRFKGLHALVIGSEMSAGVRNVFLTDCQYSGYLKRGVYLKSNPDRGGFINNVFVKNLKLGRVEDCIYITSYYHNEGSGHATSIDHVYFENVTCGNASAGGVVIQGFADKRVRDIFLKNVRIDTVANALSMTNAEAIVFENVTIGSDAGVPSAVK